MSERKIEEDRQVLCAANSYTEKYYFNPAYASIPSGVQEELKKIMVSLAEETGGIVHAVFDEYDGSLIIDSYADESDFYYDNIGAGIRVRQIEREYSEMIEALSAYYRIVVMGISPEDVES